MEYLNEHTQSVTILRQTEQALKEKKLLYVTKKVEELPKSGGLYSNLKDQSTSHSNGVDNLGKRMHPDNGYDDTEADETKRQRYA